MLITRIVSSTLSIAPKKYNKYPGKKGNARSKKNKDAIKYKASAINKNGIIMYVKSILTDPKP